MNIMDEQAIIESTYWHKCDVLRDAEIVDGFGRTVFEKDHPIYLNVPCALSQLKGSYNANQQIPNEIKYDAKLFISPEYAILTGDTVIVTFENGVKRDLRAGESFPYPTHQEIPMLREAEA